MPLSQIPQAPCGMRHVGVMRQLRLADYLRAWPWLRSADITSLDQMSPFQLSDCST